MRKKVSKNLSAVFVAFCCFVVYCLMAFLLLGNTAAETDSSLENVPYRDVPEDFSVLLECDELNQYCALIFDFENNHLTAVLFDNISDANGYGLEFKRTVKYEKKSEIDIIGWLGGIVFFAGNGYNGQKEFLWEFRDGTRIFGSSAVKLAQNQDYRAVIAHAVLSALLERKLDKQDFNYILSLCDTDISYADFCNFGKLIGNMSGNVTITTG